MNTQTINTYSITELSGKAQERAKQRIYEILEDIFVDEVQDDIESYIKPEFIQGKGFEADNVYYSLSYSQGDGAMFEGRINDIAKFTTNKRAIKAIEEYGLYSKITHTGRYYHEKSYDLVIDFPELKPTQYRLKEEFERIEQNVKDVYEETCKEIYKQIQAHHESIISDENIIEFADGNAYQFLEDGRMF
jgi:hypothetical protein